MLKYLKENIDITYLSNFKTKAKTKYYFEINSVEDISKLKEIKDYADKNSLKILFIGGGTNLLFAFDIFEGIIIKNNLVGFNYNESTKTLSSYTNEKIRDIALNLEKSFNQNIWHRFIGLPGSVGGAVFGNAGCFGLETENNFLEAEVYNLETGEIKIFSKNEINFSYRNSIFKEEEKYFIIKAKFDLSNLSEKYSSEVDNIKFREEIQPKGNSCGSFFKNHSREFSAGYLIEQVGLKGYVYKNAYFSDKHANFLITKNEEGDYRDLIFLINLAKTKVKEKFDIDLIPEVRIIKN